MSAARVVDLPDPVAPVTSTSPRFCMIEFAQRARQPERFHVGEVDRDETRHQPELAALPEHVQPEAPDPGEHARGVELVACDRWSPARRGRARRGSATSTVGASSGRSSAARWSSHRPGTAGASRRSGRGRTRRARAIRSAAHRGPWWSPSELARQDPGQLGGRGRRGPRAGRRAARDGRDGAFEDLRARRACRIASARESRPCMTSSRSDWSRLCMPCLRAGLDHRQDLRGLVLADQVAQRGHADQHLERRDPALAVLGWAAASARPRPRATPTAWCGSAPAGRRGRCR